MKGTLQIITLFTELKLIKYIGHSKMLKIFQFWHTYSTNLSGDWKEMDNSYTSVDKLDSAQNQTADENLEKSPETSRINPLLLVKTVVLHHRIQGNVQIVSCQTFQQTVILILIKVITYLREKRRHLAKFLGKNVMFQIKFTNVKSALNCQNQNNQLLTIDACL